VNRAHDRENGQRDDPITGPHLCLHEERSGSDCSPRQHEQPDEGRRRPAPVKDNDEGDMDR
jgi:hypothetical protein